MAAAPRRWRRRLLIAALALVAALLVIEGALRLIERRTRGGYPVGMLVADEHSVFRMAPHFSGTDASGVAVRTNAFGFRGADVGGKRPGTPRILVLGDSFTFGHGVDEGQTFPRQLEQRLAAAGRPAEVLNAGVPGFGTHNELGLLEACFDDVQPDRVLVALYVGNDFYDNATGDFGRLVVRGGFLAREAPGDAGLLESLRLELLARSRLALLLSTSLASAPGQHDPCADFDWNASFGYAMLRAEWEPPAQRAFDATCAPLQRMADACALRGVPLALVLLPGPCQYSDVYWSKVVRRCGLDEAAFLRDRPNAALAQWAHEHGVPVLDLLPPFRERMQARPGELLFTDVHFSVAGHALAAEELEGFLGG